MANRHDIIFIGSSQLGLRNLIGSPHFTVREVLCLSKRLTPALRETAEAHQLRLRTFAWHQEFRELVERHPTTMPFFIYQLDMLVPADLTKRYGFYNVHRGNLLTNRGPNPDIWPILRGDRSTSLSLHKIDDKVDAGILIDAIDEPINADDDAVSLRNRLDRHLPALIQSLHAYLQGSRAGTALAGGAYRPWVEEADFTLNLSSDTIDVIDRKIRSQRPYNGAILNVEGAKYYVLELLSAEPRQPDAAFFFSAEAGTIRTCSSSHIIALKWNEHPKYPSPPVRPPSKRI